MSEECEKGKSGIPCEVYYVALIEAVKELLLSRFDSLEQETERTRKALELRMSEHNNVIAQFVTKTVYETSLGNLTNRVNEIWDWKTSQKATASYKHVMWVGAISGIALVISILDIVARWWK